MLIIWSTQQEGSSPPVSQAAWPALIGAEMVVNGDCGDPAGWAFPGVGGSIAASKMALVAYSDTVDNSGLFEMPTVSGASYRCNFTADVFLGGGFRWTGGVSSTTRSAPGVFSEDLTADGNYIALEATTAATATLDNFSVKSVGLLGVEANWSFAGSAILWLSGPPDVLNVAGAGQSDIASLTGSAATAFDAAVSTNTACLLSATTTDYIGGDVSVSLRGGPWVALGITGIGVSTPVAVTSGAGSGFRVRGNAGGTAEMLVAAVQIELA